MVLSMVNLMVLQMADLKESMKVAQKERMKAYLTES